MMTIRASAICALGVVCVVSGLDAQALSQYRNFELGSDLASVSTLAGVAASEAKTIRQKPAVLQSLEWRLSRWIEGSTATSTDPVEQILFSFYNDQLFRIVVDYGHERTEGMTDADMIEAISGAYGVALKRVPRAAVPVTSRLESESGASLARWGDAAHTVVLYRTSSYGEAFRLIVTDAKLDALARKAEAQSVRLDQQDAPRREVARQKKAADEVRAATARARAVNKGVFRP